MRRYQIKLSPTWQGLLLFLGVSNETAFVEIGDGFVRVKFGYFEDVYKLSEITAVEPLPWPWYNGIGLRYDPKGIVGLIGSSKGVVKLGLSSPKRYNVIINVSCTAVAFSLHDADNFIEDMKERLKAHQEA